ncbi:MAG: hypothetical protein EBR87_11440, partial [Cytophagia bacterium]|nr:hypothetical protein [Cytophagia bacterium]
MLHYWIVTLFVVIILFFSHYFLSSFLGNFFVLLGITASVLAFGFLRGNSLWTWFPISFAISFAIAFLFLARKSGKGGKSGKSGKDGFLSGIPQYNMKYSSAGSWPQELVREFLNFQAAHNPEIFFDMDLIQEQATPDEVRIFLKNGQWPWSSDVQRMYREAIMENSYISMNPGSSLSDAQMVYNENAIKQLLSWNSKEGDFLLGGVIIGHPNGMPKNVNNTVRCVASADGGETVMQKKVYTGYNGINGSMSYQTSLVPNDQIPNIVPGFSFLNGKVCNPCAPLNSPPDYSCPFIIDTGNGTEISDIWEKLWSISGTKQGFSKAKEFPPVNNSYLLGVSRK